MPELVLKRSDPSTDRPARRHQRFAKDEFVALLVSSACTGKEESRWQVESVIHVAMSARAFDGRFLYLFVSIGGLEASRRIVGAEQGEMVGWGEWEVEGPCAL